MPISWVFSAMSINRFLEQETNVALPEHTSIIVSEGDSLANSVDSLESVQCQHHWLVASPIGDQSVGRCQNCGSIKEFATYPSRTRYRNTHPQKSG